MKTITIDARTFVNSIAKDYLTDKDYTKRMKHHALKYAELSVNEYLTAQGKEVVTEATATEAYRIALDAMSAIIR